MLLNSYNTRSKIIKRLIFWSVVIGGIFALLFAQTVASAQPADPCEVLGGCIGNIEEFDNNDSSANNIVNFVLTIVRFLIFIGAAIAVAFIVVGGYYMITSNGNPEQYKKGLNTLLYAVIGLIVSIISVTIVALVGSLVTNLNLDI
ncbi:MAG: hypothetical protein AAGF07_02325 [Patescibacteria group bacterium]